MKPSLDAKKESHNVTCRTPIAKGEGFFHLFAESEGFKPPIPERGIPDFESSAIDHSANSPIKREQSDACISYAEREQVRCETSMVNGQ